MRAPIFIQAVLASLSFNIAAAQLSTLPSCAQTCVANMLNQATSLGCTSASDTACLCASSSFTSGSKDCTSQSCGAEQLAQVNTYFSNMCSAPATATTTGAASSVATGAAVSTVVVSAATSSSVPGAAMTHGAATGTTTAPTGVATTTAGVGIGSNSTMTTSVRTSSASSTSSSGAAHIPVTTSSFSSSSSSSEINSNKDSSDTKKSTGLSSAAKAGIGIGVSAVAVAMIIIVGVFFFKKNHGASEYNNDKMNSSPMASAGSQFGYSSTQQRLSDSGGELKAIRYEDMVSQAAPRNMV